jgi:acetoin utilization protein AcuB
MASTIERWMKLALHTVKPRDSVAYARALIEEHRINHLPVVQAGRLVGIVTDRDLRDAPRVVQIASAEASGQRGKVDPDQIPVEAVMSSNVITLRPTDTIDEAARVMLKERFGALLVTENGALRGILTRSDLLEALLDVSKLLEENGVKS